MNIELLARLDTRTPAAGPETVDLTALASRLTEQYPLAERPLTLTCASTAPAYVHGNPDEYERLLRNHVDNAARHTAHRIQVTVRNEDDRVVLTVHDDGPGVPGEAPAEQGRKSRFAAGADRCLPAAGRQPWPSAPGTGV